MHRLIKAKKRIGCWFYCTKIPNQLKTSKNEVHLRDAQRIRSYLKESITRHGHKETLVSTA